VDSTHGCESRVVDAERLREMGTGLAGGLVVRSEVDGRDGPVAAARTAHKQLPIVAHEQQEHAPVLLRAGDVRVSFGAQRNLKRIQIRYAPMRKIGI
jgi:hypothetical protein